MLHVHIVVCYDRDSVRRGFNILDRSKQLLNVNHHDFLHGIFSAASSVNSLTTSHQNEYLRLPMSDRLETSRCSS
jgi:hypothetical protein